MVNELEEYEKALEYLIQRQLPPIFHDLHYHLVWLLDASGHAGAIHDEMDGTEKQLKESSHAFTKQFEAFYLKAVEMTGYLRANAKTFPALQRFTSDVALEMKLFQTFLKELEELELTVQALSTFSPLMVDYLMREEKYYVMKLKSCQMKLEMRKDLHYIKV